MGNSIKDVLSLRLLSVLEKDVPQAELDAIREQLGIPPHLEIARAGIMGEQYGPQWRDYTIEVAGVPYKIDPWTGDFAPGGPRMVIRPCPGGPETSALVLQAWGMRACHRDCPVVAVQTWHPSRGFHFKLIADTPKAMTAGALKVARRGLDLLIVTSTPLGRPPRERDGLDDQRRAVVRQANELKRKYPSLPWKLIASRLEVRPSTLRDWRNIYSEA